MNAGNHNIVKDALNCDFLSMIQSDLPIPDAYKKQIEEYGYGLVTSVSNVLHVLFLNVFSQ